MLGPLMADAYLHKDVAGQFRISQRIGSGGMGAVYKAEQPDMNRFVAIKILHPKYLARPDLVSRFRREARAMSHLSHPNTARVFLYGQLEDGACYFVMEYLEGRNLAQTVRAEGPLDPVRAINIMVQVCGALEEAHRAGIIHRDLKPENIFLTSQGGIHDFPKVLDFGLAKVTEREMRPGSLILTREGMVFGTPEFMSPEQARGKPLDGRSDIYSLGMIFYEMLTGKLPFDAKQPMEFINHHVNTVPIPLSQRAIDRSFPPGLEEVLMRALAKEPEERYPTAAAFAEALRACAQGQFVSGPMRALPTDARSSSRPPVAPAAAMMEDGTGRGAPATALDASLAATVGRQNAATPPANNPQPAVQNSPPAVAVHQPAPPVHAQPAVSGPAVAPKPSSKAPWIVFGAGVLLAIGGVIALIAALLDQ
jgi:serine/threonine-protein kinase